MNRRAVAAIGFLVGCGGSRSSEPDEEVVLRVSATAGLSELMPGLELSGSSAAASDLVFAETGRYIESIEAEGTSIILTRKPSAGLSTRELAAVLRGADISSARAVDDSHIEANAGDEKTASLVAQYQAIGFDLGPFKIESQDRRHIRLARRAEGSIDVIELVSSTRADEWRRLLAHELDVVPLAASLYRSQFAGIASVRILDMPATDTVAIYFNVRKPSLADARVRRRIAAAIHREAMARVVCGVPGCASPPITPPSETPVLPTRLSVILPEDFTTVVSAAKILRYQLFGLGIELDIQPISTAEFVDRQGRGDYLLALAPLSRGERRFGYFLSPGHPKGISLTGFASPDYDQAFDRGDFTSAQAILDRELPVTRLFDVRSFAAVDASFCGDVTPSASSWLWLSQLHPCDEDDSGP